MGFPLKVSDKGLIMGKAADSKMNDALHKKMQVSSAVEDRALVFPVQHGDITAFQPLFSKYRRRVSMGSARFFGNQEDCADPTQELPGLGASVSVGHLFNCRKKCRIPKKPKPTL